MPSASDQYVCNVSTDMSPTLAALSTAAAVAAISSCYSNNINNNHNSNRDNNTSSNLSPTTAALQSHSHSQLNGTNNNNDVNSDSHIDISSAPLLTSSVPASLALPMPIVPHNNQGTVNANDTEKSDDAANTRSRKSSSSISNNVNTFYSSSPCPTPGPLAPPSSRLLQINQNHINSNTMLPQNQLVFHNSHPHTNNNNNGSMATNTITKRRTSSLQSQQQPTTNSSFHPHQQQQKHHPPHLNHTMSTSMATSNNTTTFRPRQMQLSTVNIFANTTLRRGKWTAEEERFSNALIEEFEKGTILDCENGCTLRAYLSRKLHCAPMRISKKYAGKSIGKHVFLSRMSSLNQNGVGVALMNCPNGISAPCVPPNHQANLEKIRDLEFRFHMSLLQEGAACALGKNIGKTLSGNANSIEARVNMNAAAVVNQAQTAGNGQHIQMVSSGGGTVNSSFPMIFPSPHANFCTNHTTAPAPSNTLINSSSTQNINPTAASCQWFAPGTATTSTSTVLGNVNGNSMNSSGSPSTVQMQETLLNAFKEAQTSSSASSSSSNGNNSEISQQKQMCNMMQSQFNILPQAAGVGSIPDTQMSELFSNFQSENKVNSESNDDTNSHISTSQAQQNWLSETMHIIPTLDPSSCMGRFSPTYTSKSFDDLHQFIGSDCSPSVSNEMNKPKNSMMNNEMNGPATDAANVMYVQSMNDNISAADAYALFAQQSATVVSKHAAYANPCEANTHSSTTFTVTHNQSLMLPPDPQQNRSQNPASGSVKPRYSTTSMQNVNVPKPQQSPPIQNNVKAGKAVVTQRDTLSATFNAANLQLHSAAVEEMDRADKAAKDSAESESVCKSPREIPTTTISNSKFVSSSVLSHANVVSGSDQSSSYNGNESSSAGGSRSSGSDNSSDNSDSASDEIQASASFSVNKKCKRRNNEITEKMQQNTKRQKLCVQTVKNTTQK